MNAVANTLLVRETLTRQAGYAAISAVGPAREQTRPTMTWHISTNGRPVIRWVMLPARSSIMIDER